MVTSGIAERKNQRRVPSVKQELSMEEKLPNKNKAHAAVAKAIREGKLVRLPCEKCGNRKSLAHHTDYSKQLEVMWLCAMCHREWHRENGYPKGTGFKALVVLAKTHHKVVVKAKKEKKTVSEFIISLLAHKCK